jgi:hypothetical protein
VRDWALDFSGNSERWFRLWARRRLAGRTLVAEERAENAFQDAGGAMGEKGRFEEIWEKWRWEGRKKRGVLM